MGRAFSDPVTYFWRLPKRAKETHQTVNYSGLARAGGSNNRNFLPGHDVGGKVLNNNFDDNPDRHNRRLNQDGQTAHIVRSFKSN